MSMSITSSRSTGANTVPPEVAPLYAARFVGSTLNTGPRSIFVGTFWRSAVRKSLASLNDW